MSVVLVFPMSTKIPTLKKDDDAQVGIGTMIVFIATILVAAVAAGVLINVSGGLQSKAVATGNEATENVASNLYVQSVYGEDTDADATNMEDVIVYLTLGAGSEPIDLDNVVVQYTDGSILEQPTGTAANIRGDGDNVLEAGELLSLTFTPSSPLTESVSVSIDLIPAAGNAASVAFTSPDTFGGNTFVQLF